MMDAVSGNFYLAWLKLAYWMQSCGITGLGQCVARLLSSLCFNARNCWWFQCL